MLRFFPLFFGNNCLTIGYASFGENKIDIGSAIFTLISINGHYCAMSQNLFWPPSLNRIFFFKFYLKIVNLFMFFDFDPKFIEKFLWESGFSNFGHVTVFSFFGRHFETKNFVIVLFADIWLFWVYTHMVQVSYRNSYGRYSKMDGSKWTPLCTNGSEK